VQIRVRPTWVFPPIAALIYLAIAAMARSPRAAIHLQPVALGALADCVLTVPLVYWLLTRRHGGTLRSMIGIATLGLSLLQVILPAPMMAALAMLPGLLPGLRAAIGLGLLWLILPALRQWATAEGSWRHRSTALLGAILPPPVAAILKAELMIGYYAFFAWRAKPEIPAGATAFSYHRSSMDIYAVGLLAFLSVTEAGVGHVLLRLWSVEAAWALTDLSVLGVFYLIGTIRAFALRPVLLDQATLTLRLGLLRSITLARDDIRRVDRIDGTPARAKDLRRLCLLQPANLLITTTSGRIACYVDEPQALIRSVIE